MKTSRNFKILVLALSLVLIIGAVLMISASADEALTVSITKKNISYGDVVKVLFAVDDTKAGDNEVEVLYYLDDPQANPDAKAYKGEEYEEGYTEGGVTYPAFFTAAFPAKDIGAQVYAQAHIVGTDVYSEIVRYSVVEYCNKRLYVDTDSITEAQKGLYETLLTYGAYAQKVLLNEDNDPYNDVTQFVDEMVYVSIEGGTLDGKYSTGVYFVGDKVTPFAEGAVMWTASYTDADGNSGYATVGNNSQYTVAGRSFISLNNSATLKSYFDYYEGTNADGWDFDNDSFTTTQAMANANLLRRATWSGSHRDDGYDAIAQGTNEYVKIQTLEDSNRVFEFGTGHGAREGIFFRRHSTESVGYKARHFVFEAKVNLNIDDAAAQAALDAGDNYIMSFFTGNTTTEKPDGAIRAGYVTGTEFARIYTVKDSEGEFHYYFNYATDNTAAAASSLSELKNGWNTVTAEMTLTQLGTCTVKYYVNGCQVGSMSFDGTKDAALLGAAVENGLAAPNSIRFKYNSVVTKSYVRFDNVFCSYASQPTAD